MFIRALAVWFLIIFVESIHGIARRLFLEPFIGDLPARQVSVLVGSAIILLIAFIFVRWLKAASINYLILAGLLWVVLTVGFEAFLGKVVFGLSWERIVSDYDLAHGGLMALGLFVMLISPLAAAKMRM